MKTTFTTICTTCNDKRLFIKFNLADICNKVHLPGFSMFGGVRYYTFREVLVKLGVRKQALVGKCVECASVQARCPNCKTPMSEKQMMDETCHSCHNNFYICV